MTQQDKELLLRYLSMALPYGVKVQEFDDKYAYKLLGIDGDWLHIDCPVYDEGDGYVEVEYCKAFLRPMSSMTEEEINEFILISDTALWLGNKRSTCILSIEQMNWLNVHHFDFLGLIHKGIAIEVTEENNPYK